MELQNVVEFCFFDIFRDFSPQCLLDITKMLVSNFVVSDLSSFVLKWHRQKFGVSRPDEVEFIAILRSFQLAEIFGRQTNMDM